tara:strand:- start:195 stop:596 length:402 start_codon:yes stop_codon:yes gene_type:complete
MISKVIYKGSLRTEATHLKSGNTIITDAPTDNQGKGEAFAPSDLVATAVASCMLTVMGIFAQRNGINMDDTTAEVEKAMRSNPRMISSIGIKIYFNNPLNDQEKKKLERVAKTCPVESSLNEKIKKSVKFIYT